MTSRSATRTYQWQRATGLLSATRPHQKGLQGALVPGGHDGCDHVAVVYDTGDAPPEITIRQVSGTVHQVLADGIAVAIIAQAAGRAPDPEDVLLVERCV